MAPDPTSSTFRDSGKVEGVQARLGRQAQHIRPASTNSNGATSFNGKNSQERVLHPTHTADASARSVDEAMANMDRAVRQGVNIPQLCPWHTQQITYANQHGTGLDPMNRYMAEGASEQSAIYYGAQKGTLSTTKACTCAAFLSSAMNSTSRN